MLYTINGTLATLNDHDKANRYNRFAGAKLKKEMTELVAWQVKGKPKITKPCVLSFSWYISSKCDYDNICFARKYLLDGMVKAGILKDDSPKYVLGFGGDSFIKVEKGKEKIIVDVDILE